jgi:hypothetical protein
VPPIQPDSYYPSRNVASALAFIYDYCYEQLGASLKPQMVTLMNQYFDDVRVNGYQAQNYSYAADGNYFGGHLYGVAMMGYASFGDNARAQEMIDWARIRFDGTPGSTLPPSAIPDSWRSQVFDGGLRPAVALTGGPASPATRSGRLIRDGHMARRSLADDYMLTVKARRARTC